MTSVPSGPPAWQAHRRPAALPVRSCCPETPEHCQRKQQLCRQQHGQARKKRPAEQAGCCGRSQPPPEQEQDGVTDRDDIAGDRRPQKLRFCTVQPADHTAIEDHCAHGREPPGQFPEFCHNGSLSVVRPPSSEEPVAALRAVLWVGTEPYFPFAVFSRRDCTKASCRCTSVILGNCIVQTSGFPRHALCNALCLP